jgi:hypothetical protein
MSRVYCPMRLQPVARDPLPAPLVPTVVLLQAPLAAGTPAAIADSLQVLVRT